MTSETLTNVLEMAPTIVILGALFIAGSVLKRRNPAWLSRWRKLAAQRTRVSIFVNAAAAAIASALVIFVARVLGMLLEFRVTGLPPHILYLGWFLELLFTVIIASSFSFLYPSKEDEPEDWLDWPKDESRTAEEA